MKKIEMVDLRGQYEKIKSAVDAGIQEVIDTAQFVKGGKVKEFEQEFCEYVCLIQFNVECTHYLSHIRIEAIKRPYKESNLKSILFVKLHIIFHYRLE